MARRETHEVVDTPRGKRMKIIRAEERVLDRDEVGNAIDNLNDRIDRLQDELADAIEARDDLIAKRAELE
jgi:hypothetical protein